MDRQIELTAKQQHIVESSGKFVVKACPGSGKTFSVAARIAHLIKTKKDDDYLAIAALSFTNVACDEIQKTLEEKFGINIQLQYPHFVGTIDSFVNNFIFLPYGHLFMGCEGRPELIGEPHNFWNYTIDWKDNKGEKAFYQFFDRFSFNKNNEIIAVKDLLNTFLKGNYKNVKHHIKATKERFFKKGNATQIDGNYIAFKLLDKYEGIAKNLTKRFTHFIIDEAQDTTDVQMGIIDILERHGAREIVLIGDPNQAIFEWNDAKPKLFEDKYIAWERSKEYDLNENRRSSKLICNSSRQLLQIDEYDVINRDVKDYPFQPQIVGHKEKEDKEGLQVIVKDYLDTCAGNNIPVRQDTVAILYRSHSVGEWLGIPTPDKKEIPWKNGYYYVKDIFYGKYLIDNGIFEEGFKYLERGYHKYMNADNRHVSRQFIDSEIEKIGYKVYRNNIFNFIGLLPTTRDVNLHEWITATNRIILSKGYINKLMVDLTKPNKRFDELFGIQKITQDQDYFIGTIHSAKGKTFEAVLLVLGEKGGNSCYRNMINLEPEKNGLSEKQKEELRNVYVAITRPRKILIIAVPEKDCSVWGRKLKIEL